MITILLENILHGVVLIKFKATMILVRKMELALYEKYCKLYVNAIFL